MPNYDGFQATATALRMASRLTGRATVLLPENISVDKLSKVAEYLHPNITIERISFDPQTGLLDLAASKTKLTQQVAAVYFERSPPTWVCSKPRWDRSARLPTP